jgi:hypothetical protein
MVDDIVVGVLGSANCGVKTQVSGIELKMKLSTATNPSLCSPYPATSST